MKVSFAVGVTASLVLASAARAQHEGHTHAAETLGTVDFPTSCRPEVAAPFTRAMALLHSFGYEEARKGFEDVAREDAECGLAQWGIAMTYYHPIWAPPTASDLTAGRAAAEKAAAIGAKTERERAYIATTSAYFREADARARAQAFRQAMEHVARRFPDDDEAAIFHALTLLATAPPGDASFANQKQAMEILTRLLARHPDHPGVAHYMIHSFDYPALASEALPAARAYARIAPSSPHALHMPSHIFTRLGLWPEAIASNIASAAAGQRLVAGTQPGAASYEELHALDYLEYAYLQIDDQAKAREVLDQVARVKAFDEPTFQAAFALVAVPARFALERRDWKSAALLELPQSALPWAQYPYIPPTMYFARALGAARSGQAERARDALAKLQQIQTELVRRPIPGPYDWAGNVESMRLAAAGVLARTEGRVEEALRLLRSGAELDEKTGKHPVTPGQILPPRELLADVLLESGHASEALVEYEKSLQEAPERFNGLVGAARAAAGAGQRARAAQLYARLVAMAAPTAQRPELEEARKFAASVP